VHTHPSSVSPRPSERDVDTARALRLPVTVVTRSGLFTALPGGDVVRDADGSWLRGLPAPLSCGR
jgi:hypothetical protein